MRSHRFYLILALVITAAFVALPSLAATPHGDLIVATSSSAGRTLVNAWGAEVMQATVITETVPLSQTAVVLFVPPVPEGQPQEGSCWTNSLSAPRDDAWRCMVVNQIYDPCFLSADGKTVVCGANPVTDEPGLALKLTQPLPAPVVPEAATSAMQNNGWLVELADGSDCNFMTGATAGIDGERINYGCSDGEDILGDLMPGTPWQANKVQVAPAGEAGFTVTLSVTVPVVTVYQ